MLSHRNLSVIGKRLVRISSRSKDRNFIRKIWHGNIVDLRQTQLRRIQLLDKHGKDINPEVAVLFEPSQIIVQQRWIDQVDPIDSDKSWRIVEALAQEIDRIHDLGIVHGDLCYSNVGLRDGVVCIFDWEPLLAINLGLGRVEFRTTQLAFHPSDLKKKEISFASDRLAFICLFLQMQLERYAGLKIAQRHLKEIAVLAESHNRCATLLQLLPRLGWFE